LYHYCDPLTLPINQLPAAEGPHGVPLLEAVQGARCGARLDVRERRHGHELTTRGLDLEVEQRADGGTVLVTYLRDDFVAAVEKVEAIHVRATEQRPEFLADASSEEPEVGEP